MLMSKNDNRLTVIVFVVKTDCNFKSRKIVFRKEFFIRKALKPD